LHDVHIEGRPVVPKAEILPLPEQEATMHCSANHSTFEVH
jgi:hypothetical protein